MDSILIINLIDIRLEIEKEIKIKQPNYSYYNYKDRKLINDVLWYTVLNTTGYLNHYYIFRKKLDEDTKRLVDKYGLSVEKKLGKYSVIVDFIESFTQKNDLFFFKIYGELKK